MLTLCIDTAYKYLTCVLIKDDEIISSYSKQCFKRQSEEVFLALKEVFEKANIEKRAIDSICISKGPGSYTGLRIAMSIAKTIGEILPLDVYTISTLRLYAANKEKCMVLMDARSNRAYVGIYDKDKIIQKDSVLNIEDINPDGYELIGDASIFNQEDDFGDIPNAFLQTKHLWKKVDNIAYLKPEYLKESEKYYL